MKTVRFAAALAFAAGAAITNPLFAAGEHSHATQPLHGGVLVVVKDIEYELVAKPEALQLHLRDHGKPVDVSNANAKLILLTGTEKQEVELKPAAGVLAAKGSFRVPAKTKVMATVWIAGKSSTARFVLP